MRRQRCAAARSVPETVPRRSVPTTSRRDVLTDHRINLTLYKLDKIMNGDIQEIIDACIAADQAKKLANMND